MVVVTDTRNAGEATALERKEHKFCFGHVELGVACETAKWSVM